MILLPLSHHYHRRLSVTGTSNTEALTLPVSCIGCRTGLKLYMYYFPKPQLAAHSRKPELSQMRRQSQYCFSSLLVSPGSCFSSVPQVCMLLHSASTLLVSIFLFHSSSLESSFITAPQMNASVCLSFPPQEEELTSEKEMLCLCVAGR